MIPSDMPSLPSSAYTLTSAGLDAYEQLQLELINRARLNPSAEASRQGTSIGNGVSSSPSQALAYNAELSQAAQLHSNDMIAQNFFSHDNPFTGTTPFDRMRAQGYNYQFAGENIGAIFSTAAPDLTSRVTGHHNNLWNSLGHRQNFMNDGFSEVGLGFAQGSYTHNGFSYQHSSMMTQNFGDRGKLFLTGVVIDDMDGDLFYDIGEGQGSVRVTAYNANGAFATSTWNAGGYSLELSSGTYTVVFEGGDLKGPYSTTVTVGNSNVKLDVIEDRDVVIGSPGGGSGGSGAGGTGSSGGTNGGNSSSTPSYFQFVGSDDRDFIRGTTGNDAIISNAGHRDRMWGDEGSDIFIFGDETHNGVKERAVIKDYEVGVDKIIIDSDVSIESYKVKALGIVLKLSDDHDRIAVRGVFDYNDLTIEIGTDAYLG